MVLFNVKGTTSLTLQLFTCSAQVILDDKSHERYVIFIILYEITLLQNNTVFYIKLKGTKPRS